MSSKDPYKATNYEGHALWCVMKGPILAAALFASVGTAHAATQWWVLNASEAKCQLASTTGLPSPYVTEQYLRHDGNFQETKVYRDTNNAVTGVAVFTKEDVGVSFFVTRSGCLVALKIAMDMGTVNDPKELR